MGPALLIAVGLLQTPIATADLSLTLACGKQPSELTLSIANTGTADSALRLGVVLANGAWYQPKELAIELVRVGGEQPETLVYEGLSGIGGRIDHWIAALPARATFTLVLQSSDFISTTQPTPASAPEAVAVRLTGRPITEDLNPDMSGLRNWKVWTGTARSNQLRLSDCTPDGPPR